MKVAIIGPGALGCLLAALFFQAGEEVLLVDYRPERAQALRRGGLKFRDLEGREQVLPVTVAAGPDLAPADLAVMTVKAHQTATAARHLTRLLAQGGLALTLQNGLGNLEKMAQAVGPERLLAGVSFVGATRPRDGEVIFAGAGPTYIGAAPGSRATPEKVAQVAALFHRAGLACEVRADIEAMLWEKLLVNVGINPLTAILRVLNGALPRLPEAWEVGVAAAQEAMAVARASGIALSADPEALLSEVCNATAKNRSSMLQDVLAGRETEIEALNGEVAARGAALSLPTPVNLLLTRLVKALTRAAPRQVG